MLIKKHKQLDYNPAGRTIGKGQLFRLWIRAYVKWGSAFENHAIMGFTYNSYIKDSIAQVLRDMDYDLKD